MNKIGFSIVFLIICFSLSLAANPSPRKEVILLTYPRSGTNWTIGILQALCKRPVRFLTNPTYTESLGLNRLGFEVDESLPFVYRSHTASRAVRALDQNSFALVFTLRNFKECIVKQGQFDADQFLDAVLNNNRKVSQYFKNLRFFDSGWKNPETKHLVIYENIVLNPKDEILSLLNFLGEDTSKVPAFFENYDQWNQEMLASYHEQHATMGPPSNNELIFHSKSFPKDLLLKVDQIIKERHPYLWKKYLMQYAEKND